MLCYRLGALGAKSRGDSGPSMKKLQMVYGKVFVAGGSKGVGRAVIDKLVEQGSEVVALVRREEVKAELEAITGALEMPMMCRMKLIGSMATCKV